MLESERESNQVGNIKILKIHVHKRANVFQH